MGLLLLSSTIIFCGVWTLIGLLYIILGVQRLNGEKKLQSWFVTEGIMNRLI